MTTDLRIDRISLQNFRCFKECAVDLHPMLTVFVAENGSGKTAILDAIGIALRLFIDVVARGKPYGGFHSSDIRLIQQDNHLMVPVPPTSFMASGFVNGQQIGWSRALNHYTNRLANTSWKDAKELRLLAMQLRDCVNNSTSRELSNESPVLPLVASYGTDRLWNEQLLGKRRIVREISDFGRMSGYIDCLSAASSFSSSIQWYETRMNEIADSRFSTSLKFNQKLVAAVRKAVRVVLRPTGWCNLDWNSDQKLVIVEHSNQGRLPLSALSDGVRTMVALVMDIARRCASLNPHLGEDAAEKTPGILIIDEVDMHLHPGWQQQAVELLRQAFPEMQLICSTHSPHVLSTVDRTSIRIIHLRDGNGLMEIPQFQTRGVVSADVLTEIMGVDPIPQVEEAQWVSNYQELIEDGLGEEDEALCLRTKLIEHFGNEHPIILDCDRLLRFQAFKRRRSC
jgi:predicted ATP-binding protein involved in virulence